MKKLIVLVIAFYLLLQILPWYSSFCIYATENDDWEYEFSEFNDDFIVLNDETHQAYLLDVLESPKEYSSGIYSYDTFMEAYYDNLTTNLGMNYKGSCGYVAIGMLLSYYDTYLCDDIIPEQYDVVSDDTGTNMINRRNSPGIERDYVSDGYNLSALNYYEEVNSMKNTSLHAKLITIGHYSGYYNFLSNSNMAAATTFGMLCSIMNKYLLLYRGYSGNDYTLDYEYEFEASSDNSVRDFTIQNIQNGNPVLLTIQRINPDTNFKEGHAVVAYDYDEATDEIYCHFGWGGNKTHITPESEGFNLYKAAYTINFNLSHSHTNNYAVSNYGCDGEKTSNYYCYNNGDIITYNNTSTYGYEYLNLNEEYHKSFNEYGEYCTERHMLGYTKESNGIHIVACDKCEYSKEEPHNFEYTSASDYQHINTCIDCGFTYHDDHDFIYNEIDSGYHTTTCSKCDYTSTDEHYMFTFVGANQHGDKCHECGYVDESTLEDHTYDSWTYLNDTTHIRQCRGCNARGNETAPHAFVPLNPLSLKLVCVGCGYTKMKDSDYGNIIMSNTKVSLNGSYIMPDGTIMLVDEDIEAYLNGTLVFYNKDDLPVVQ